MIKLTIQKEVTNEQFEQELKAFEERNRYGNRMIHEDAGYPRPTKVANLLEVTLTEEQYEAIKKAVIEKF